MFHSIFRSDLLKTHALIAGAIQAALVIVSIIMLTGITKRRRLLMLPWLIIWGIGLPLGLVGALFCVFNIPGTYKISSVFLVLLTVLVVLPTWFFVLHLYTDLISSNSCSYNRSWSNGEDQIYVPPGLGGISRKQDLLFKYLYA